MPFDWMHVQIPEAVQERNQKSRRAQHEGEIKVRSSLLRRMGYPVEYALERCLGNQGWAFEMRGTPPLTPEEIRGLVDGVYKR